MHFESTTVTDPVPVFGLGGLQSGPSNSQGGTGTGTEGPQGNLAGITEIGTTSTAGLSSLAVGTASTAGLSSPAVGTGSLAFLASGPVGGVGSSPASWRPSQPLCSLLSRLRAHRGRDYLPCSS